MFKEKKDKVIRATEKEEKLLNLIREHGIEEGARQFERLCYRNIGEGRDLNELVNIGLITTDQIEELQQYINEGCSICIVGPCGHGKTTLLHALLELVNNKDIFIIDKHHQFTVVNDNIYHNNNIKVKQYADTTMFELFSMISDKPDYIIMDEMQNEDIIGLFASNKLLNIPFIAAFQSIISTPKNKPCLNYVLPNRLDAAEKEILNKLNFTETLNIVEISVIDRKVSYIGKRFVE